MNMNNNQVAYMPQFSPYEIPMPQFSQHGLGVMPGFTPCVISTGVNPEMQMLQPLPFFPFQPLQVPPMPIMQASQSPVQLPLQQSPQFFPQMPILQLPVASLSPPNCNTVTISSPQNPTPTQNPTPASKSYLGAALGISRSRSQSVASESDSGYEESRYRSVSRESDHGAPSKRALVDSTLGWMESIFGDKYDNEGTRGENVLRLKVKTVIALEHIVNFISRCHDEGLIESISCPVSTKKGRQHVRGYLAYIKGFNASAADRIETIFEAFNQENGFPFKTLHRNPASTL